MQLSDKNELFIKLFSRSQKVETMRSNFIELFDRLFFNNSLEWLTSDEFYLIVQNFIKFYDDWTTRVACHDD